jgi:hypothetical protein
VGAGERARGAVVSSDEEPVAWLRAQIEADGRKAATRLRRAASDDFRRQTMEKLARAKAELAILDEHRLADYGYGPYCRTCFDVGIGLPHALPYPCRTVALLAGGYRHRPGFPAAFAASRRD